MYSPIKYIKAVFTWAGRRSCRGWWGAWASSGTARSSRSSSAAPSRTARGPSRGAGPRTAPRTRPTHPPTSGLLNIKYLFSLVFYGNYRKHFQKLHRIENLVRMMEWISEQSKVNFKLHNFVWFSSKFNCIFFLILCR